eukprot:15434720-Alexandrium_andersonii.AAC.1
MPRQKAQILQLQREVAAEGERAPAVTRASRAENEHLAALARQDAAKAQAEQACMAEDARLEIAALRE